MIGYIKGKSAIHVARGCGERKRNFVGEHSLARVHIVPTVGRDEGVIRAYSLNQEEQDKRLDQMKLGYRPPTVKVANKNGGSH